MSASEGGGNPEADNVLDREEGNLRHLGDTRYDVVAELGREDMPLSQVRALKVQDIIELRKLAGEPFEIRVNDRVFAEGEIVVVTDQVSVRVTRLVEH